MLFNDLRAAAEDAAAEASLAVDAIHRGEEYVLRFHPAERGWQERDPEISTWRTSAREVDLDPVDAETHIAAAVAAAAS